MHKHGVKGLYKWLVVGVIIFVAGQNALAYDAGWEAVDDYNGYLPDLSECVDEGENFEDAIATYDSEDCWDVLYSWTNSNAWEQDFKDPTLGGDDSNWADNVDLVLFAGHGSRNGFYFEDDSHDDHLLHYNDAIWGNNDLEWIIIDACQILLDDDTQWDRWDQAFDGLHYILSWNTVANDVDTRGELFIKYAMYYGYTVRVSWIYATQVSSNNLMGAYMRGYSTGADTYNDHLWCYGSVSADPTPTTIYYSTWNT